MFSKIGVTELLIILAIALLVASSPILGMFTADPQVIALTTRNGNRLKGYVELGPEEIREIYKLAE